MKKERIDLLLVKREFFPTRQSAQRAIMAGLIFVDQERVDKPGIKIRDDAQIEIKGKLHPYVSRGGLKLEEALRLFDISIEGQIMLDIGASTGGFTDCALKKGVKLVYAIDVGYGQLAWSLRQDPRVIVMERTNFRYLDPKDLQQDPPTFATIDVSFISLSHILPNLHRFLLPNGLGIALIKPQFEAGREKVGKKGIVKDPGVHKEVLKKMIGVAETLGFAVQGIAPSPIQGSQGNIEFLLVFIKKDHPRREWDSEIENVVFDAHHRFLGG